MADCDRTCLALSDEDLEAFVASGGQIVAGPFFNHDECLANCCSSSSSRSCCSPSPPNTLNCQLIVQTNCDCLTGFDTFSLTKSGDTWSGTTQGDCTTPISVQLSCTGSNGTCEDYTIDIYCGESLLFSLTPDAPEVLSWDCLCDPFSITVSSGFTLFCGDCLSDGFGVIITG